MKSHHRTIPAFSPPTNFYFLVNCQRRLKSVQAPIKCNDFRVSQRKTEGHTSVAFHCRSSILIATKIKAVKKCTRRRQKGNVLCPANFPFTSQSFLRRRINCCRDAVQKNLFFFCSPAVALMKNKKDAPEKMCALAMTPRHEFLFLPPFLSFFSHASFRCLLFPFRTKRQANLYAPWRLRGVFH